MTDAKALQLDLFDAHVQSDVAFRRALDGDDLTAALPLAPKAWLPSLTLLWRAQHARTPKSAAKMLLSLGELPPLLQPVWHRLLGRALATGAQSATHAGLPAGWYLLQGGDSAGARAALQAYVQHLPCDAEAWRIHAMLGDVQAAIRCGFHGGPILPELHELSQLAVDCDPPPGPGLVALGWLDERLTTAQLQDAVQAIGLWRTPPLPEPDDGFGFTAWLAVAEETRTREVDPVHVRARKALQTIHAPMFARFLGRLAYG